MSNPAARLLGSQAFSVSAIRSEIIAGHAGTSMPSCPTVLIGG